MTPPVLEQSAGLDTSFDGRRSVAFITQNVSFGGMEVHTIGLMRALIDRGYTIELIQNRHRLYDDAIAANGWADRVRVLPADADGILYGERSDRAGWRRLLSGLASDVLIFPKGNYNYGQLGFLQECRRAVRQIVFVEHLEPRERPRGGRWRLGIIPPLGLWWHKRRWSSRLGSRYADTVIAVSAKVKDRLVTDIGFPPGKVAVVRNGVPWQRFARDAAAGQSARVRHGIPSDAFVFGMLSRLSAEKGIDTALRAVRLLVDRGPQRPFSLVVAGEGYEAARLAELAAQLEIRPYVRFIGFVREPEAVLSAFDVILFSSRVEGLPLGLLQGMAAGCIPIVTRISGMPEVVSSPEIGWVVAPTVRRPWRTPWKACCR